MPPGQHYFSQSPGLIGSEGSNGVSPERKAWFAASRTVGQGGAYMCMHAQSTTVDGARAEHTGVLYIVRNIYLAPRRWFSAPDGSDRARPTARTRHGLVFLGLEPLVGVVSSAGSHPSCRCSGRTQVLCRYNKAMHGSGRYAPLPITLGSRKLDAIYQVNDAMRNAPVTEETGKPSACTCSLRYVRGNAPLSRS